VGTSQLSFDVMATLLEAEMVKWADIVAPNRIKTIE
jgi:hypothetical protein